MIRKSRVFWVLIAMMVVFTGCDEFKPQTRTKRKSQTTAERLKPSNENTFNQLMTKSAHNVNYIVYGLLNYDETKIKRGTENLMQICGLMNKKLPDDVISDEEEKEKWKDIYREQSNIAENLNFRFEEARYDDARKELKNLLKNCMLCHKEISGIPKAELTFVGKRRPTMDMALTQVMDSNNLNFDDVLFGLIAHDMDEIEGALDNMRRASALMMAKIPSQYQSQKEKWDTYCKNQRKIVEELREAVKTEHVDTIWDTLEALLSNCMNCHKLYKPGIK